MKKIISLLASVAMLATASTSVFAAVPSDAAPKAKVSIVGDETKTRTVSGETYYMYTVSIDLSDIGSVDCTPAEADDSVNIGTRLVQLELGFEGDLQAGSGAGATSDGLTLKQVKATQAKNYFDGIYVQFAATECDASYPATADAAKLTKIESKFYAQPGEKFTIKQLSNLNKIGYATYIFNEDTWAVADSGDGVKYVAIDFDADEYTLPTFEEPEPAADVVVNSGKKYDNGYAWNVTVNKDMEAFGVKFYSGEETLEKSVKNVEDLPKLDGGVGYNFNVGLKTAKTIDKADFTADDATATWNK